MQKCDTCGESGLTISSHIPVFLLPVSSMRSSGMQDKVGLKHQEIGRVDAKVTPACAARRGAAEAGVCTAKGTALYFSTCLLMHLFSS